MLTLEWPWVVLALPVPVLVRGLLPPMQDAGGTGLRFALEQELLGNSRTHSAPPATRRWRLWVALLAWVLLVLAAARPQWVGEPIALPLAGRDLMLAVDISDSMKQPDYVLEGRRVSRLRAVQAVAARFIAERQGDRLGLILFGSRAYLQTPLTFDRATVTSMLGDAVEGLIGPKTALGDAIALAIKHLREQPDDNRVLILLTDGETTAGVFDPVEAAELALEAGVRIYAIGIGAAETRNRFGLMLGSGGAGYDAATLNAVAERTGGQFFAVRNRAELDAVYRELDRLEPSARDSGTYRPRQALFMWPAAAALLLSVVLSVPSVHSWRWRGGHHVR